jgi:flavorubredoxin
VAAELLDAGALLVGSPTLNNAIFPTVADALTYVRGLKPRHLIGAAFGSFGWSGEAVGQLEDILREMKVELVRDGLKVKYAPDQSALAECFALGGLVAAGLRDSALASKAPT